MAVHLYQSFIWFLLSPLCGFGINSSQTNFFNQDVINLPPIYFLFDDFTYNTSQIVISWNESSQCNNPIYELVSTLNGNEITNTTVGRYNNVSISTSKLEDTSSFLYKFFIVANEDGSLCSLSDVSIQLHPETFPFKQTSVQDGNVCINPLSFNLAVIWPISDNEEDGLCTCNVWFQISQCSCIQNNNYFSVYNKEESMMTEICWRNRINNTKITFVSITLNSFENAAIQNYPSLNYKILQIYQLIIAEVPGTPSVSKKGGQLCYTDIYEGNSPVLHYNVTIINTLEFASSFKQHKANGTTTCAGIPSGLVKVTSASCYPLNIRVASVNAVGMSQTASLIDNSNLKSNICDCFNLNVNVSLQLVNKSNPTNITLMISCSSPNMELTDLKIIVSLKRSSSVIKNTTVNCSMPFYFDQLRNSTKYDFNMKWRSGKGTECFLNTKSLSYSTPDNNKISPTQILIITISASVLILVAGIIIIMVSMIICLIVRKRRSSHVELKRI